MELDARRPYKPLDVGEAGVTATVDDRGRLLAVSQAHSDHGLVVLSAAPPFPESSRYDSEAARRYRRRLAVRGAVGFGLATGVGAGRAALAEGAIPVTAAGGVRVATLVPHPQDADGAHGVLQVLLARPPGELDWRGVLRLARAEYPQLTEGGPLAPLTERPRARLEGATVVLDDAGLGWAVAIAGLAGGGSFRERAGRVDIRGRLRAGAAAVAVGVGRDGGEAAAAAGSLAALDAEAALEHAIARWRSRWRGWPRLSHPLEPVARRALAYVLGCCALPIRGATCLVTDHRILPLAWTRDGYFCARALLDWSGAGGPREAVAAVRGHLEWLFAVAERPQATWARSHLVGGQPKDVAFQLDQQLYPLLELADYVEATGDREPLRRHAGEIPTVLAALERRRAPGAALYASDENPADDPLELPYQTASQILAWRAFSRLHELGVGGGRLARLADAVAADVARHQVVDGTYAYATDLAGGALRYHDANDLPLALAPAWGFCSADDPVWQATVRFAFSPANPGFFAGRHGGLGSLHTRATWPLGHVQAHLAGSALGDRDLVARGERELAAAALWDGSLPEASDPRTARPVSRPWFAWPGAAAASLLLQAKASSPPSTT